MPNRCWTCCHARIANVTISAASRRSTTQKRSRAARRSRSRSIRARRFAWWSRYARSSVSGSVTGASGSGFAAELEGERYAVEELPADPISALDGLPQGLATAAGRIGAVGAVLIPIRSEGSPLGSLELLRSTIPFDAAELAVARLAAAQLAL